ncbi:MAG: fibrobacter succinogenes major paralogous domain-containing protein [Chitinispirillia bacterium]|nr:fibrobacter succinogenes major paralogous domain-containing protein [Chitinispirillia bacterium]MCL2241392.1 fibrobacter succinogenes major paralogous domain-containing protein [Chitinispirillia bacterium]
MSASVRKVAGLVAAVALLAVVMVGCGEGDNPTGGGGDGTVTIGGQSYRTVEIGGLTWMAENLNRATSNSWCYDDDNSNCTKYGRLYTWEAAKTACPSGWRLPTGADWNSLVEVAGGSSGAGSKLKSTSGWYNNDNGTDDFGFSALPGGGRGTGGTFYSAGYHGRWWSATEDGSGNAWLRDMGYNGDYVYERNLALGYGFSVRCVR